MFDSNYEEQMHQNHQRNLMLHQLNHPAQSQHSDSEGDSSNLFSYAIIGFIVIMVIIKLFSL